MKPAPQRYIAEAGRKAARMLKETTMAVFTFKGDQLGEGLQFDDQGRRTRVEIGQVWFSATDTVTIRTDPSAGTARNFLGGEGAVVSLTVRTADGRTTTFFPSSDAAARTASTAVPATTRWTGAAAPTR